MACHKTMRTGLKWWKIATILRYILSPDDMDCQSRPRKRVRKGSADPLRPRLRQRRRKSEAAMAQRINLNERTVKALACPKGARDGLFFDATLKGFAVRVQKSGGKSFLLQYRLGGIRRRLPLGEWGVVTVAGARGRAERARGAVAEGRDPWAERR